MSKLSFIITGSGRISAVANGQPYTVDTDHPNYKQIKDAINKRDAESFIKLVDIPNTINAYGQGRVTVQNGAIYYGDKPINNSLAKRILWMIQEGFDVKPFITFLENLMMNPSRRAVNELYTWMEHQSIPITEDGCWIGYKYLNEARDQRLQAGEPTNTKILIDVHSDTIRQWVGKVVEVPRNEVDEDWGIECSEGLHIGSANYSFSGTVRVYCKVNPRDVVTVPPGEINKCRVCRYEIVGICDKVFSTPVVGPNGENIRQPFSDNDIDGDDFDDFEYDFDDPEDDDTDEECEYCGDEDCCGECMDESNED